MVSKRDIKMLEHAKDIAELSDYPTYHVGCVIALKNKILNASFNTTKTHPLQKTYNVERFQSDTTPHSLHAEIHALAPLIGADIDWKNVTVYVARKRKCDGKNGLAMPCKSCMKAIRDMGVKNIVYTTDFGVAHEVIE